MKMVQGCVALLPVVTSSVLLRPAPVTARHHYHPQHLRQYPEDIPAPEVLQRYPDDLQEGPDAPWRYASDIPLDNSVMQQYLLSGVPQGPDDDPQDFHLQQYLQSPQTGSPSSLQEPLANVHQEPDPVHQYQVPAIWWHPRRHLPSLLYPSHALHPALWDTLHSHQNTGEAYQDGDDAYHNIGDAHQNSLDVYEHDEDVHGDSISAHQNAVDAHQEAGDTYQNISEDDAGAGEALLASPAAPCWYHLAPEPTLCPSRLFQVLGQHLAGASSPLPPPAWTTPTTHGLPPTLQWLRRPPSKRYLGIELPDYIATSYSSVKTDNAHYLTKLHQLKQRMRNAGK